MVHQSSHAASLVPGRTDAPGTGPQFQQSCRPALRGALVCSHVLSCVSPSACFFNGMRSFADGGGGGSAPAPRKRSKTSAQAAAHDLQQQSQQEGYDPARLAQQVTSPCVRAPPCSHMCPCLICRVCLCPRQVHALAPYMVLC